MADIQDERFDKDLRAIFEDATEEVPDRVWEGISRRLDEADAAKLAPVAGGIGAGRGRGEGMSGLTGQNGRKGLRQTGRKGLVIWLQRAGVGLAAAAAIFLGVFLLRDPQSYSPADMDSQRLADQNISVVPPASDSDRHEADAEEGLASANGYAAEAEKTSAPANGYAADADAEEGLASANGYLADSEKASASANGYLAEARTEGEGSGEDGAATKAAEAVTASQTTETAEAAEATKVAEATETDFEKAVGYLAEADIPQTSQAGAEAFGPEAFFEDEDDSRRPGIELTMTGNLLGNTDKSVSTGHRNPMMSITGPGYQNRDYITETDNTSSFAVPISFGVGTKIILTPRWSIGAGLNYTLLSRSFSGLYTTYNEELGRPEVIPSSKITNIQHYVGLPVNAYFSILHSDKVDFYAYAGGMIEKCVSNRYRVTESVLMKDPVAGFQFSANAGIGVEFIIADVVGIYIDPHLRYYFKNANQPTSIRTFQPLSFGFELGFRVRL